VANGNKTTGDIRPRNGAGVPRVQDQEDCPEGVPNQISFVAHDAKSLIEVLIYALDKHRIVVCTQENMTIDFEEVQGLTADAEELAVFVKHSCMAKVVLEKNAHDGGGKSGGRGIGDRFHAGKTAHSAAANKVRTRTLKTSVFARSICVKVHYQKWSLDWEVVDKF
jgi:hypothetical protein